MTMAIRVVATIIIFAVCVRAQLLNFSKLSADKFCSPRHITVHNGYVYIAEAGIGPSPVPSNTTMPGAKCLYVPHFQSYLCWGNTGRVSKIPVAGGSSSVVLSNLFSARQMSGPGETHATGPHAVAFDGTTMYTVIGLGANGTTIKQSGFDAGVVLSTASGATTVYARPWEFEFANNPDGTKDPTGIHPMPDSNPYHAVVSAGKMYLVDAGGNDLLTYNIDTKMVVNVTVFPKYTGLPGMVLGVGPCTNVTPPRGPHFCGETKDADGNWIYSSEHVPVAVRMRPKHTDKIYVAGLSGQMWTKSVADIKEITMVAGIPTATKSIACCFRTIVDFDFHGPDMIYVLESNPGLPFVPFSGRLTRVDLNNASKTIVAEEVLHAPSGLVIHSDTLFISNATYSLRTPCKGEIISAPLPREVQAAFSPGLTTHRLIFGIVGVAICAAASL